MKDRVTLKRWLRDEKSSRALALRSRIVLACARGATTRIVAAKLGVDQATVLKWRTRLVARRLKGFTDEPRPVLL